MMIAADDDDFDEQKRKLAAPQSCMRTIVFWGRYEGHNAASKETNCQSARLSSTGTETNRTKTRHRTRPRTPYCIDEIYSVTPLSTTGKLQAATKD